MKIETSLDWSAVDKKLRDNLNKLDYNHDLHKMHKNIGEMIRDLSRLEVDARRTNNRSASNAMRDKINAAISRLDALILMAILMR
jgi:hypothetical protein